MYKTKSFCFEDRTAVFSHIEEYVKCQGLEQVGDHYSRRVYGCEEGVIVLTRTEMTFMTCVDIGTSNEKFLEDLVGAFPQLSK